MSVNLYYSYYKSKFPERLSEIDFCFNASISDPNITKIYVFDETGGVVNTDKIEAIPCNKRLTFKDYFNFINIKTGDTDVNIIMNTDCCFDVSTSHLLEKIKENECWCLSRWDVKSLNPFVSIPYDWNPFSQDAWIFRGKIKNIPTCDWTLGVQGCDSRISHEIHSAGYDTRNPMKSVKLHHIHMSEKRSYNILDNGDGRIHGAYRPVEATEI
jgi:hypothetical protein